MTWTQVAIHWSQICPQIRERWSDLTDDEVALIDGEYERFVGLIQERYGFMREEAERELGELCERCAEIYGDEVGSV
jgi:uncharacterized protein YjbJ (UPF0337 family)